MKLTVNFPNLVLLQLIKTVKNNFYIFRLQSDCVYTVTDKNNAIDDAGAESEPIEKRELGKISDRP